MEGLSEEKEKEKEKEKEPEPVEDADDDDDGDDHPNSLILADGSDMFVMDQVLLDGSDMFCHGSGIVWMLPVPNNAATFYKDPNHYIFCTFLAHFCIQITKVYERVPTFLCHIWEKRSC